MPGLLDQDYRNGLARGLLNTYQKHIGDPFASVAGGAINGYLGLEKPSWVNDDAYKTAQALSNMPGLGAPAGAFKAAAHAPDVAAMLGGLLGKAGVGKVAKALDLSDQARADRLIQQGYTRGMWRGGAGVADGPYYTPDASAAQAFAKRHGDKADVREYAIRMQKPFDISGNFGPEELRRFAQEVAPHNKEAAKYLPDMASDYRSGVMPGAALWQVLKTTTGGNEKEILKALGYDAINAGQEVVMLQMGNVRDANRAAFDPAHLGKVGPFLGLTGIGLLGGMNEDSSK